MRNQKRVVALVLLATAAMVVTGGLVASNMGFKLNQPLLAQASGVSQTGRTCIGLPFNKQVGIVTANDLFGDIPNANEIQAYNPVNDGGIPYPAGPGSDFPLEDYEGWLVQVSIDTDYIIVGSHDPSASVAFTAIQAGVSKTGRKMYAHPYHGVNTTAQAIIAEIPNAVELQGYNPINDGGIPYPAGPGSDFPVDPGDCLLVQVSANSSFTPQHY
jgi:hypothetical protein